METQQIEKKFIQSDEIINEYFVDDLPQDVLLESLIVSQIQPNIENTIIQSEEISKEKSNEKIIEPIVNVSNSNSNSNDQYLADLLLAMDLQQAEEENFHQRRAHDEIRNGKYCKVRETAPKMSSNNFQFYYETDTNIGGNFNQQNETMVNNNSNTNGDLTSKRKRRRKNKKIETVDNRTENNNNENDNNHQTITEKKPITTKHDPKVWNQKHVKRLKAYEAVGDVNADDMHISNKAFNAIRYRLERKGFTKDPPEMNM